MWIMNNFRPDIEAKISALGGNTIDLLRSTGLLRQLIRRLLIEETTKTFKPPAEQIQQALTVHCQKEQLNNEEALKHWLAERCITRDELQLQVSLPIKLNKLAIDSFGAKAEAQFLQRKAALDQATYSLLRVKDSGLAHELYLQLEAGEANFEHLASEYSAGPEQRSGGRVGPAPLIRAHPKLSQRLRTATPGVVLEPVLIEEWWVVARLEEHIEASFDDQMHQRMASELLEHWLQTETNELAKTISACTNSQDRI